MYIGVQTLIDFIFPPSQEALMVRALNVKAIHQLFTPLHVRDITALSSFKDERVRALIHEAKFHGNAQAFALLGCLYAQYLQTMSAPMDMVIPVPLSPSRKRARGYNQVEEVLRCACSENKVPLRTDILIRKKNTIPQTDLKREARLSNMKDAFRVINEEEIASKHIMLVDDVITTGTTLHAAKETLLRHSPASVTCIALAH